MMKLNFIMDYRNFYFFSINEDVKSVLIGEFKWDKIC